MPEGSSRRGPSPTAIEWHRALAQYGGACPVCRRPLTIREDSHGAFASGCDHVEALAELVVAAIEDGS